MAGIDHVEPGLLEHVGNGARVMNRVGEWHHVLVSRVSAHQRHALVGPGRLTGGTEGHYGKKGGGAGAHGVSQRRTPEDITRLHNGKAGAGGVMLVTGTGRPRRFGRAIASPAGTRQETP